MFALGHLGFLATKIKARNNMEQRTNMLFQYDGQTSHLFLSFFSLETLRKKKLRKVPILKKQKNTQTTKQQTDAKPS